MHIRAFLGAAVLALCSLALMPVTMADPAPDICVLNLSQPEAVDLVTAVPDTNCSAVAVDVAFAVPIVPDDEDEAAGRCELKLTTAFDFASHRQHEDPGRCGA